jgi:hypothetical protein
MRRTRSALSGERSESFLDSWAGDWVGKSVSSDTTRRWVGKVKEAGADVGGADAEAGEKDRVGESEADGRASEIEARTSTESTGSKWGGPEAGSSISCAVRSVPNSGLEMAKDLSAIRLREL